MKPTIVVAASRKGDPTRPRELWADVALALRSVACYAAELDLLLAWQGPCPPGDLPDNPRARIVRQPDSCRSFGEAYGFAVAEAGAADLILMNDDVVLTPSTIPTLLEDVGLIRREHPELRIGLVCCRSNWVPGPQNVRHPNGGALRPNAMRYDSEERILACDRVSPILGYISRGALDDIGGFPPINWYSDDLMCWDLRRKGYVNFVSRAYVHHVGQRSTTQGRTMEELDRAGREWVRANRPDFWAVLTAAKAEV